MPTVYSPPVNTYTPLASITLAASATEVTLTGFSQDYRDLVMVMEGNGLTVTDQLHFMYFNGDFTNSNYSNVRILADSGGYGSDTTASPRIGNIHGGTRIMCRVQIWDFSASDKHKTFIARADMAGSRIYADANRWANTSPITSITVRPNSGASYASGMSFKLFGIKA